MGKDVNSYYKFKGEVTKYEDEFNKGDKKAALKLAYYYKDAMKLPSGISHKDVRNSYKKWLGIYVNDAIKSKNKEAIKEIKLLAKLSISGFYGKHYTDDSETRFGKWLYKVAYEWGDVGALDEMRNQLDLAQITKKREETYQRRIKVAQDLRRRKRLKESRKSTAEKLGEIWGGAKREFRRGTQKITKPISDIIDDFNSDFNRGERRKSY